MSRKEFVQQSWFVYPVAVGIGIAIVAGLVDFDVGIMTAGGVATAAAVVAAVGPETDRWRTKVQADADHAKMVDALNKAYKAFLMVASACWAHSRYTGLYTGNRWRNLHRTIGKTDASSNFSGSIWSSQLLDEPWQHYDELVGLLETQSSDTKKNTVVANAITEYSIKMHRLALLLKERDEYERLEYQLSVTADKSEKDVVEAKLAVHDDVPPELIRARLMELYEAYRTIKKAVLTMSLPTYDHESVLQDLAAMSATDKTEDLLSRFAAKNEAKIKAARRQNA